MYNWKKNDFARVEVEIIRVGNRDKDSTSHLSKLTRKPWASSFGSEGKFTSGNSAPGAFSSWN